MNNTISIREKRLRLFGRWFITPFFAIGSGMITTVAFSSIAIIASLALPWLIPILALVFLAESAISIYLFKDSVPDTLSAIFITGIFKELSPIKKVLLSLGLFSALGGGLALGALTYTSGVTAISAVLGLASIAFPPFAIALAAVLGIVGCIAFASLLIKWISTAIKTDIHLQVIDFFKKMFTRDESKSLTQQILENIFKGLFTFSIIAVSIIGTIATLGTMQKGLIQFFSLIPQANLLAVKISSGIIAFGLMGIARLPWALQSVCSVFSLLGEMVGRLVYRVGCSVGSKMGVYTYPEAALAASNENTSDSSSWKSISITLLKVSAVVVHGVSFGALAKSGGGKVISDLMTDLHFPLDATTIEAVGEGASMVTGGMMAAGIGGFTLFANEIRSSGLKEPVIESTLTNRIDTSSQDKYDLSTRKKFRDIN